MRRGRRPGIGRWAATTAGATAGAIALLATSGCGSDMTASEATAAKSIAGVFAGKDPSAERKQVATCFGKKMVTEAGIAQLKSDEVIDSGLKAATTVPKRLSERTAEAYGDGLVSCFDFDKLKKDIAKDSGASSKQVDAYVECLGKISDGDLKQSIVDRYTKAKSTALTRKVDKQTKTCGQLLGT